MSPGLQGTMGRSLGMQQAPEVALGRAKQLLLPLKQHQRGRCKSPLHQCSVSQWLLTSMGRPQG